MSLFYFFAGSSYRHGAKGLQVQNLGSGSSLNHVHPSPRGASDNDKNLIEPATYVLPIPSPVSELLGLDRHPIMTRLLAHSPALYFSKSCLLER